MLYSTIAIPVVYLAKLLGYLAIAPFRADLADKVAIVTGANTGVLAIHFLHTLAIHYPGMQESAGRRLGCLHPKELRLSLPVDLWKREMQLPRK